MNSPLPSKKEIDELTQYLPRLYKDGSIDLPEAIQPYMRGLKKLA
jgi:hypothetical protein